MQALPAQWRGRKTEKKDLEKVLEEWHSAGITDLSQAQGRKRPNLKPKTKTVSAQQYTQREYSEEELSAVSGDLIEEAKKQRG